MAASREEKRREQSRAHGDKGVEPMETAWRTLPGGRDAVPARLTCQAPRGSRRTDLSTRHGAFPSPLRAAAGWWRPLYLAHPAICEPWPGSQAPAHRPHANDEGLGELANEAVAEDHGPRKRRGAGAGSRRPVLGRRGAAPGQHGGGARRTGGV